MILILMWKYTMWFSIKSHTYGWTKIICRYTEEKPCRWKGQADLPHYVEWDCWVVPDLPVHNDIYKNTYGEFNWRNYNCSDKTALYQRHSAAAVYGIKYRQDSSAGESHCPVGVATIDYLNHAVYKIAHEKGKNPLWKFHSEIPRSLFYYRFPQQCQRKSGIICVLLCSGKELLFRLPLFLRQWISVQRSLIKWEKAVF